MNSATFKSYTNVCQVSQVMDATCNHDQTTSGTVDLGERQTVRTAFRHNIWICSQIHGHLDGAYNIPASHVEFYAERLEHFIYLSCISTLEYRDSVMIQNVRLQNAEDDPLLWLSHLSLVWRRVRSDTTRVIQSFGSVFA